MTGVQTCALPIFYDHQLSAQDVKTIGAAVPLQDIFSIAQADRSKEQTQTLLNHYLNNIDPQFPKLQAAVTALQQEQTAINARSPVTHVQVEKQDSEAMAHILMRGE